MSFSFYSLTSVKFWRKVVTTNKVKLQSERREGEKVKGIWNVKERRLKQRKLIYHHRRWGRISVKVYISLQ